jgi:hypothetical protein
MLNPKNYKSNKAQTPTRGSSGEFSAMGESSNVAWRWKAYGYHKALTSPTLPSWKKISFIWCCCLLIVVLKNDTKLDTSRCFENVFYLQWNRIVSLDASFYDVYFHIKSS